MRFPPQFLDELRARTTLADVIARKVKLVKKGREHTGLCPFHSEKTPSFTVSEEKGFYHCFGCGAHGDAIAFLTESEGISFPEAVERLAAEAGMEVPRLSREEEEAYSKRSSLYDVLEVAAGWFENKLAGPQAEEARAYLEKRGLSGDTITHFRLGFAPRSRSAFKEAMLARKFSEDQLVSSGMLVKAEEKDRTYDRFRNRIIFPITDGRGRVVAFGGRAMGEARAKYLNSPETPLFHKGEMLYNLAGARKPAFEKSEVIVAEGYTDVIALHQAGFPNAVAPLGTALTEAQMALLWRLAPEPVLCFDGDQAGVRAAGRALERALPLLRPGHSLKFALLPSGEDPDSLIQREGAAAFTRVLAGALGLSDMLWRLVTQGVDISTPERRAGLEKKAFDAIGPIRDEKVRGFYMRDFKDRLFHTFRPRKARFAGRFGPGSPRSGPGVRKSRGKSNLLVGTPLGRGAGEAAVHAPIEELMMLTLLHHPALLVAHHEDVAGLDLAMPELDRLKCSILEAVECDSALDPGALRNHLVDKGFEAQYLRLTRSPAMKSDWFAWPGAALADAEKGWTQTLKRYRRITSLQEEYEALQDELARNTTEEGFERLRALQKEMQTNSGNESDLEGYGLASARPVT